MESSSEESSGDEGGSGGGSSSGSGSGRKSRRSSATSGASWDDKVRNAVLFCDDAVFPLRDIFSDPLQHSGLRVQIVYSDVEEPL